MAEPLEFWFEFASPYSYLSAARIEALAASHSVTLAYKPFLLGPVFAAQGWDDSPFNIYPAKGKYLWDDMTREAEALEIPFRKPSVFPRGSLLGARIVCAFEDAPWIGPFIRAVFASNFAHDRSVDQKATLAELLDNLDLSPSDVFAAATAQENKDKLRKQTELAMQKGLFGAPSFVIRETLFWGNDRLERALAFASSSP